ncbi:MAG: class I SAM-dependent methyltransferase [Bacteroidales bacterium]|nr:class I SAM-dependent methyltransferase [Bacteroidales bacterium]
MTSLCGVLRYIKYYLRARNSYSLHSPFVFELYTKVISDKQKYPEYKIVEKRRRELLRNKRLISVFDMGAGAVKHPESFRRIKTIIKRSSSTPAKAQLLFRLARYFNPEKILELGTSMGISTMYLSCGAPQSEIITIEGCSNISSVAESNFRKAKITNIQQNIGNFEILLPKILKKMQHVDLLFVDGDHKKEKVVDYFEKCLEYSGSESVFIFDDIHWSNGMESAWEMIINHPRVKVSIDLFYFGILFFKEELSKERFILRF